MIKKLVLLTSALLFAQACQPPAQKGGESTSQETQEAKKGQEEQSQQITSVAQLAEQLLVKHSLITNRHSDCDPNQTDGKCYLAQLSLSVPSSSTIDNWSLYFSNMSPVQKDHSETFDIEHINGDLHKLSPNQNFTGFRAEQEYTLPYVAGFWMLSNSDRMPNYYLVDENSGKAFVIASTQPVIDADSGLEILPHAVPLSLKDEHFKRTESDNSPRATAEYLYSQNSNTNVVDVSDEILPTPKSVEVLEGGERLDFTQGISLEVNGVEHSSITAALERLALLGVNQVAQGVPVSINVNAELGAEAYELAVLKDQVKIVSGDEAGAFYALQSLASGLNPKDLTLAQMVIKDAPRFEFRGMHLDVSRNFKSKDFVLQVLEEMGAYKLNKFHFHLADDEGWRVEIEGLPELTDIGAFRCHDLTEQNCLLPQLGAGPERDNPTNGYYSIADYKEILAFAKARHIQVIPSMDMPGHSRAAIKSMAARHQTLMQQGRSAEAKQYLLHDVEDSTQYSSVQFYNDNTINACMPSAYDFIDKVVDELAQMHAEVGTPLTRYHIGADETAGAWIESSACKELLENNVMGIESAEDIAAYFIEKVSRLLAKKGIEAAGWNDGMGHTKISRMPESVQSNAWSPLMWNGHQSAHEQANRNWDLVVSSPDALYFDFPYEADAHERGYYWAARRINSRKLFSMMPENLPAHAEYWLDRQENPYVADDRLKKDADGKVINAPLKEGIRFHGMQGQLWSETVRTDRHASYMIFPRLYALAERAWYQAPWEVPYNYDGALYSQDTAHFSPAARQAQARDWQRFANVIGQKVLPEADRKGLFYRLPTAGGKIENSRLRLNSIYPNLPLQYRVNNGPWLDYHSEVEIEPEAVVEIRTMNQSKSRSSRALRLNAE